MDALQKQAKQKKREQSSHSRVAFSVYLRSIPSKVLASASFFLYYCLFIFCLFQGSAELLILEGKAHSYGLKPHKHMQSTISEKEREKERERVRKRERKRE